MSVVLRPFGRVLMALGVLGLAVAAPPPAAAEPDTPLRPGAQLVFAGTGLDGHSGDGFPADEARISKDSGLSAGPDGTVYLTSSWDRRVRAVSPAGIIDTVWTPGPRERATAVAIGPDGRRYVVVENTVLRLEPDGTNTVVAGSSRSTDERGDGGPATAATFGALADIAVGPDGALYLVDGSDARVRRVGPDGIITTYLGGGTVAPKDGSGGPATSLNLGGILSGITSIAVDRDGNLYFVHQDDDIDPATLPFIGKVAPDGTYTLVAGSDMAGFVGDGGPATKALLSAVLGGIDVDADGNLYVVDGGNLVIRMITPDGTISTVGTVSPQPEAGDLAVGPDGDVYTAGVAVVHRLVRHGAAATTTQPAERRDRWAGRSPGTVVTVAGTGHKPLSDDVPKFEEGPGPTSIAVGPDGTVHFADADRDQVGELTSSGPKWTIGRGVAGESGKVDLNTPDGLAVGADGKLYLADGRELRTADKDGHVTRVGFFGVDRIYGVELVGDVTYLNAESRLLRVDATGAVTTIIGGGVRGVDDSTGRPAAEAGDVRIGDFAVAPDGTVYFLDRDRNVVYGIGPDGILRHVAGDLEDYRFYAGAFSGDGGPATAARLNGSKGVAAGPDGSLFIADTLNNRIRRVTPDGVITTYAGTGEPTEKGDGGAAAQAALHEPVDVAFDGDGNLYVLSTLAGSIRRIGVDGVVTTIARFDEVTGPATDVSLDELYGMTVDRAGTLYISVAGKRMVAVAPDGAARSAGTAGGVLAAGPDGSIYAGDHTVKRRYPDGLVTPVVGRGVGAEPAVGSNLALTADIEVHDQAVGPDGLLYVAADEYVYRVERNGELTRFIEYDAEAIAFGPRGELYLADKRHQVHRYAAGTLSLYIGPESDDGDPVVERDVSFVNDVVAARDGTLYLATGNGVQRETTDGQVEIVLQPASVRDKYGADQVSPEQLALDVHGNLYVDDGTGRVRVIVRPGEVDFGRYDWVTMWFGVNVAVAASIALLAFAFRRRLLDLWSPARVADLTEGRRAR